MMRSLFIYCTTTAILAIIAWPAQAQAGTNEATSSPIAAENIQAAAAPANQESNAAAGTSENWRYCWHNNQWWYWLPAGRWMFYQDDRWNDYQAAAAPAQSYTTYYSGPTASGPTTIPAASASAPSYPSTYSGRGYSAGGSLMGYGWGGWERGGSGGAGGGWGR